MNRRAGELSYRARRGDLWLKFPGKKYRGRFFGQSLIASAAKRKRSAGILGERGAIVKVKVIRNYDLGWILKSNKQVPRRRRYSNRRDTENGVKERKRGKLVDSFSDWSFKNREFASTAFIVNALLRRYSRDSNFFYVRARGDRLLCLDPLALGIIRFDQSKCIWTTTVLLRYGIQKFTKKKKSGEWELKKERLEKD